MRETRKRAGLVVPFVLFVLAGCFGLGRKSPTLEQYVLGGSTATEGAVSARDRTGFTIGLRKLDLAPYLATPAIVVRRGAQQIITSEFHRWGEDPGASINRAVARFLVSRADIRAVDIAPWSVQARYDYLIQLHVSRFEGAVPEESSPAGGEAHVAATWEIIRQHDGAVLARGATDHRAGGWRVGDYAGLVSLLDNGLNVLARDLGSCVATLGPVTRRVAGTIAAEPYANAVSCGPRSEQARP